MSTGRWFRTHRRQVITHTSIIVGFVLLVAFVAEPLFDRLEAVEGESSLVRLSLPTETKGMMFHFDEFVVDSETSVFMRGWAFIHGEDYVNSDTYIVLESSERTYVFTTETMKKPSLTEHFREMGLNLDHSAYWALIPAREIADGEYTVGIYIRKGDIEALNYTDKAITKIGGSIELTG